MAKMKSSKLIGNVLANGLKVFCGVAIGIVLTPLLIKSFGVEGFGLFCTIGASGVFFAIFTSTINRSVSRELSFELGESTGSLEGIFCTVVGMQLVVAAFFTSAFLMSVPTLTDSLQIPNGWEAGIRTCLYLVAVKFGIAILVSPFRALFYAHQQHAVLASLDTTVGALRFVGLGMVLLFESVNPLLVYVSSNFLVSTVASVVIVVLARRRFAETHFRWNSFRFSTLKSISKYASSAFLMNLSYQLRSQGLLVFFNVFFGNLIAAALGVSSRVSNLLRSGVGVFSQAIQPAITTSTGAAQKQTSIRLANLNSAASCLSAIVLALPFLVDSESILAAWLGEFPEFAPLFIRIVCVSIVVSMASYGHASAMHADGRIGWYVLTTQAVIGGAALLAVLGVVFFDLGPQGVLLGELFGITIVAFSLQLLWPRYQLGFPVRYWVQEVLAPILMMLCVSLAVALLAIQFGQPGIQRAIGVGVFGLVAAGVITTVVVLKPTERRQCRRIFTSRIKGFAQR